MTKKRFIKLMMSRGYSRNTAKTLATQVSRYGSYAAMYLQYVLMDRPFEQAIARIRSSARACLSMSMAFHGLAASVRRFVGE